MNNMSFLVMGVCGSGKSTIARMLADALGAEFLEADDFHPESNREKMRQGIPLAEQDREPWLASLASKISQLSPAPFVLACSALKEVHRQILRRSCPEMRVVLLHGSRKLLENRLTQRDNHFMPASLLDSQLATLEIPASALTIDSALTPSEILSYILTH
jgi:carbohydrate kinase (thermoresistant glucokinase family)